MSSYNHTQANAGQPSIRSRFDWLEVFCSMLLFSLVWVLSELPTTWGACLESRASSSFSNALASSSVSCDGMKERTEQLHGVHWFHTFHWQFYNGYFGEPGDEVLLALRRKIRKGSGYSWQCVDQCIDYRLVKSLCQGVITCTNPLFNSVS